MRELLEKINNALSKGIDYLLSSLLGFLSMTGFLFGSLALMILMIQMDAKISIILFSFKIVGIILGIGVVLVVFKFYFWLIKKYLLPLAEKQREEKIKEFDKHMRSIIREELKTARRKK